MRKAKFLFLAVVAFAAFTFTACGGATEEKKEDTKEEKNKDKDEESEFYDKEAVGQVIYFGQDAQA